MATAKSVTDNFYASYCAALADLNLQGPQSIVVALGGGADSQTVLDLTLRYRRDHPEHDYLAIHLDHYFHPDSPHWAEFLRQYCTQAKIDHIIEPLQVDVLGRQSKEAQGREARYRRLAELTPDHAVILLGHHLSDQSETFFLQLKRGAGPKGLSAMAKVAPFVGQRRLCRPLLGHSKHEIYSYAKARKLGWIEDDTNTDTSIERNFLRHDVMPILNSRWPQFEQTLARSARLCAEQQALLDELLAAQLNQRIGPKRLSVEGFELLSVSHQGALIRLFLQREGVRLPSEAQLHEVLKQLPTKSVAVRWGHQQLRSYAGALYLLPLFADVTNFSAELDWHSGEPSTQLELPDKLGCVRLTALNSQCDESALRIPPSARLRLTMAQPGDKFKRRAEGQWHSVAQLLKKSAVAPWERRRWPVLWVNGQLAWVAQLGVCQAYANEVYCAASADLQLQPEWVRPKE